MKTKADAMRSLKAAGWTEEEILSVLSTDKVVIRENPNSWYVQLPCVMPQTQPSKPLNWPNITCNTGN